jgi:hypothetical protein
MFLRIVDARLPQNRATPTLVRDESFKSNIQQSVLLRDIHEKAQISQQNKKMAVKLFN